MKGVEGANSNTICTSSLAKAVKQIRATISESRWYANKENSKIILLSRHKTDAEGKNAIDAVMEGYKAALRKGILRPNDKVEYWFKKGNKRRIMELNAYLHTYQSCYQSGGCRTLGAFLPLDARKIPASSYDSDKKLRTNLERKEKSNAIVF